MRLVLGKKQLLIDENGNPRAVVLELSKYNKLLKLIEDLEDSLDLKHAIETSPGFISHEELLGNLKKQGIL